MRQYLILRTFEHGPVFFKCARDFTAHNSENQFRGTVFYRRGKCSTPYEPYLRETYVIFFCTADDARRPSSHRMRNAQDFLNYSNANFCIVLFAYMYCTMHER